MASKILTTPGCQFIDLTKDSEDNDQFNSNSSYENISNENETSERQTITRKINDLDELREDEHGSLGGNGELFAVSYVVKDANTGIVIDEQATIENGEVKVNLFDVPKKVFYDLPTIVNNGVRKTVTAFRAVERQEILAKKDLANLYLAKSKNLVNSSTKLGRTFPCPCCGYKRILKQKGFSSPSGSKVKIQKCTCCNTFLHLKDEYVNQYEALFNLEL